MQSIIGKVWKYGDNINTDIIFPGKYTYTMTDPDEMAKVALQDLDPDFGKNVNPGDIIAAGRNFGCGSSREQAAFCLKYARVGAIVAVSFSRLFFRNCINAGLPLITLKDSPHVFTQEETVIITLEAGSIQCRAGLFHFPPLPDAVIDIFKDGGLIPHTKKILGLQS